MTAVATMASIEISSGREAEAAEGDSAGAIVAARNDCRAECSCAE